MDDALILESTFLIDLEREARRGFQGPAHDFLARHPDHRLLVTFTIAGELAAGSSLGQRERWEEFLAPFRVLPSSPDVCWEYGQLYRYLQTNGLLIGGNDLWIAATALAYGIPVVTANPSHFRRVPGLDVTTYRE